MQFTHPIMIIFLIAALSNCRGQNREQDGGAQQNTGLTASQRREVLAKVGDHDITLGEFVDRLSEQSPYLRARYNSPERRRELLESMIRFELLAQEAERRGYQRNQEVVRAESQALVQELLRREIDDRFQLSDITEAEIETYYRAHPEEFNQPDQVRASHIRMADKASAQRILQQILVAPENDDLFIRLARENSNDAITKDNGGDLRFFSRLTNGQRVEGAPPVEVVNAAFTLSRTGEVYPRLVQSPDGFHIVRLTARRQAFQRSLEEARRTIQNRLYRERREQMIRDFVERLRRQANIQEDPSVLSSVHVDQPVTNMNDASMPRGN